MRNNYEEDRLQMSIVHYLRLKGFLFTFTGGGMIKNYRTQITANRLGYLTGVSDLIVWCRNGTLNIECKRPAGFRISQRTGKMIKDSQSGKQSESQKDFERKITSISGHRYIVVTSLDEVIKYIQENNIQPK